MTTAIGRSSPWSRRAARGNRRFGRRGVALTLPVLLCLGPGSALADPWGLSGDGARAADGRPPPPDWIQGTDPTWGSSGDPNAAGRGPNRSGSWDAGWNAVEPEVPVSDARPTWGGPAPAGPPAGAYRPADAAPAYRFRNETEPRAPDAVPPGGGSDYRFRGQIPARPGEAANWSDFGGFRFRPLTERERARQGPDPGFRTGVPESGAGPGSQFGPGFGPGFGPARAWAPGPAQGAGSGEWPSR